MANRPEDKEIHPFFKQHHTPEEIAGILEIGKLAFERYRFKEGVFGEYFIISVSVQEGKPAPRLIGDKSLPGGAWWYTSILSSDEQVRGYFYSWNLRDTKVPQELLAGASSDKPVYLR